MRKLLFSAVLGLATLSACSKGKDATEKTDEYPTASLDDVEKGLTANTLTAVDCNVESTRKKFGIVPGAVLIADEETYVATDLPADKARKLVFYCSGPT